MRNEIKERLLDLCAQAVAEQDPKKLEVLLKEINGLLEEKRRQVGIQPPEGSQKKK
jgi:hypothetical protein